MPLEIKHHTVPHLKGLNSGLEPLTSRGRGSNVMGPMLAKKRLILYHRDKKRVVCYALNCILLLIPHLLIKARLKLIKDQCEVVALRTNDWLSQQIRNYVKMPFVHKW